MPITNERREQLIAKYKLYAPPNPDDSIATAIIDGEQTLTKMYNWSKGIDLGPLFDPVWSPEMYAVADRAMRALRAAMARGEIDYGGGAEYARNRGPECDPDQIEDGVLLVNYVGHDGIQVVRGGEGQHFAALFHSTWRLIAGARTHHDCEVRIAPECTGAVEFWPLQRGQFLLMFTICKACRDYAIQVAGDGYQLSQMDAHERAAEAPLPAWAKVIHNQGGRWWTQAWAWLWWRFGPPTPPYKPPTPPA